MEGKIIPYGMIKSQKQLADIIRQKRKLAGFTQSELAAVSFVGTRFISDLENGKPTLEIGKVMQVMHTLGLVMHIEADTQAIQPPAASQQKLRLKPLTPYHLEQLAQNQQIQIPVFKKDEILFLPLAGSKSSHILKLAPPRFKSAIPNEIFCRLLAKSLDLSLPSISGLEAYQNTFLLALNDLHASAMPAETQKENLQWAIFHSLTGNAHTEPEKNILCTAIYPDFSPTKPLLTSKDQWMVFAEKIRVKPKFVLTTLEYMAEKILSQLENAFAEMEQHFKVDVDVVHKICQLIETRVATIKES